MFGAALGCEVITLEPVPANIALIRANLRNNADILGVRVVDIYRNVVSSTPGNYTLSVPIPHVTSPRGWRKPLGMIGMHGQYGLIKGMAGSWLHYNVSATAVSVDDIVLPRLQAAPAARVCLLKVDVEGYE